MKIALVSPYDFPYPGGVTEHIVALAQGVRQRGHEVHIVAACSGYPGRTLPNMQVVTRTVTTFPISGAVARIGISPWSYTRVKKILQREAFDVIHLHEPLTPGLAWVVLIHASTLPQAVTVGTFHAYREQPNWLYVRGRPIFGRFFTRLDSLIAVSEPAHAFACEMFPGDYRVIPNGIDLERFSRDDETKPGGRTRPTILFVGRLDKRKGFSNLLAAFFQLKPAYPEVCLQVVGPFEPGEVEPYRRLAQSAGVTDVEFVGYVPPEEIPDFYHQADIFCAPSIGFESFGIVLLEAMAAGLPVVASNIAGYRALIADGQEGLLVPPGQPGELAGALRRLLDNPAQCRQMGQSGRLKAGQYNWDTIVDRVLAVYQETIERKVKARLAVWDQPEPGMRSCHCM